MEIKEVAEKLEKGVKELYESGEYQEYLKFASRFYNYSMNNTILIRMQRPDASLVAGFNSWKSKGRSVKKGEKAIKIIAPIPKKAVKQIINADGDTEEIEYKWCNYRVVSVFDVSQTEGKELPDCSNMVKELSGKVDNYREVIGKLENVAPCNVFYEDIDGTSHGYYHIKDDKIIVKKGMSEQQTVKTLVHEIAHSMLHRKNGQEEKAQKGTREVQAESVAYIVCNHLGIDTSDYSFGYVTSWSSNKGVKELQNNLDTVVNTAKAIIEKI